MERIELIKAAAELNYTLGLQKFGSNEPGIDIYRSSKEGLERDILFASKLITEGDRFSPDTCLVINQLKDKYEGVVFTRSKDSNKTVESLKVISPSDKKLIKQALYASAEWRLSLTMEEETKLKYNDAKVKVIDRIFDNLIKQLLNEKN